ncbi:MAG: deaminase [Candidatus Dojkabacteria bacterium]
MKILDWNSISEKKKLEISKSKSVFILAPSVISKKKISQLVQKLSNKTKVIIGCAKESHVDGLSGEQFKLFNIKELSSVLNKIDVDILEYYQRDIKYIFSELKFSAVIFINGSWSRSLHLREEFWTLLRNKTEYKLVSPFINEQEAKKFAAEFEFNDYAIEIKNDTDAFKLVDGVKQHSFDWTGQVGAVLVKNNKIIAASCNTVIPYITYSMHFGASREKNFSPPSDQNFYDTNHAEVKLVLHCLKTKIDPSGSKLYINILPCPTCARMLSESGISEVIYKHDHSDGYAAKLFEGSGIKVTRYI